MITSQPKMVVNDKAFVVAFDLLSTIDMVMMELLLNPAGANEYERAGYSQGVADSIFAIGKGRKVIADLYVKAVQDTKGLDS